MNHLESKVTPNLRESRLAPRCAALIPSGPAFMASSMNSVIAPSSHGNALCSDFDERLDLVPLAVQMNVATAILDASAFFRRGSMTVEASD